MMCSWTVPTIWVMFLLFPNKKEADTKIRLYYAHYIPELDQGVENKRLLRRKTAAKYLYLTNFDDIYKGGIQYVCNRKK